MTIREAIGNVRNSLKEINADSRLTNKFIYSKLHSLAKLLIQRESDRLKLSRIQSLYQTLSCICMEEVPTIDPNCGIINNCTIWRTSIEIPSVYSDSMGAIIKHITSIDESTEIMLTTKARLRSLKKDKNSKYDKTIYAYYDNNRIYVAAKKILKINVTGIFQDDISNVKTCCNSEKKKDCVRFLDKNWIVPSKLEVPIMQEVTNNLLASYKQIPEDQKINKKDAS